MDGDGSPSRWGCWYTTTAYINPRISLSQMCLPGLVRECICIVHYYIVNEGVERLVSEYFVATLFDAFLRLRKRHLSRFGS